MHKYRALILSSISVILAVIITIMLSQAFYQNLIMDETQKCLEELEIERNEAAKAISENFSTSIKILDLTADAIATQSNMENDKAILEYLAVVQHKSLFNRIDMIFPDGTILMQNGQRVLDSGIKTYEQLVQSGSFISQRVIDHYTKEPTIYCFSPIYDEKGEAIAVLGGAIYCSTMAEIFTSVYYGEEAQFFMVDLRDGNFVLDKWNQALGNIYQMEKREVPKDYENINYITEIMTGKAGQMAFISEIDGSTIYMTYMAVPETDFALEVAVPDDVIFDEVNELKSRLVWVSVVEIILLIGFALWSAFLMKKSIQNQVRAKEAEMQLMQKKQEELTIQADMLALLEQNMPAGYHRCAPKPGCPFIFIGEQFVELLGWTREEIQNDFDNLYDNLIWDEDKYARETYANMLKMRGKGNAYNTCVYRLKHKDGGYRWVTDSTMFVDRGEDSFFQATVSDITEYVEDMEKAKRQAEESNRAKSTFLFNLSHDIRTPMNAIMGFSQMIAENAENAHMVRETIGKIQQSGRTLMTLLNDVLELARIERGKEEINAQPMHLYEQAGNLIDMFSQDMQDAGIDFQVDIDIKHEYVMGDPLKFSRIVMNMLSNAKKFTPAGGTVSFGIREEEGNDQTAAFYVYVKDNGIGMSKEFQKRAFEQFEREKSATESGINGCGLGMAIISKLANLMGGTVFLQSELGKGTDISLRVSFPLIQSGNAVDSEKAVKELDLSGKKVLLVEDNEFNREIAHYILEDMGLLVEDAENGAAALDKVIHGKADAYDIILMDIQMPVMDGYTATQEIRRIHDEDKAKIPIIAMTANAFDEDRKRCLEYGMNGHISKPLDREKLLQELSRIW